MSDLKAKVPAELSIRPVLSFDEQSGSWCAFHRHNDTTHVATVLVNGHAVMVVGVCDECAVLMRDGTDWLGRPSRRGDRVLAR